MAALEGFPVFDLNGVMSDKHNYCMWLSKDVIAKVDALKQHGYSRSSVVDQILRSYFDHNEEL